MKAVLDTMLWVSYCTRRDGSRHRLIDRALKSKVRLFISDYILDELAEVLREDLNESARYVHLAKRAVLRRAKRVACGNPADLRSSHLLASWLPFAHARHAFAVVVRA